jgi:Holliday junction resolvase RusA-like endonuclease
VVKLTVFGLAQPAGSKRGFARGNRVMIVDANPKAALWKQAVAAEAGKIMQGRTLIEGPVRLTLDFYRPRPAGHYRTGAHAGLVKAGAPELPITKPDLLKTARACEDALTGIVYRDDAQIVEELLWKRYGEPARVEIQVEQIGSAK